MKNPLRFAALIFVSVGFLLAPLSTAVPSVPDPHEMPVIATAEGQDGAWVAIRVSGPGSYFVEIEGTGTSPGLTGALGFHDDGTKIGLSSRSDPSLGTEARLQQRRVAGTTDVGVETSNQLREGGFTYWATCRVEACTPHVIVVFATGLDGGWTATVKASNPDYEVTTGNRTWALHARHFTGQAGAHAHAMGPTDVSVNYDTRAQFDIEGTLLGGFWGASTTTGLSMVGPAGAGWTCDCDFRDLRNNPAAGPGRYEFTVDHHVSLTDEPTLLVIDARLPGGL